MSGLTARCSLPARCPAPALGAPTGVGVSRGQPCRAFRALSGQWHGAHRLWQLCRHRSLSRWVFAYNATNLAQMSVYCTTPNATTNAFGAHAARARSAGRRRRLCGFKHQHLFHHRQRLLQRQHQRPRFADSFVKLSTTNGLIVADYFTPFDLRRAPPATMTWVPAGRCCCRIPWAARHTRISSLALTN